LAPSDPDPAEIRRVAQWLLCQAERMLPPPAEEDFDGLEALPRRLIEYMRDRDEATIAELARKVWFKRRREVTDSAIYTACSKANAWLLQHGHKWQLYKARGEDKIVRR
jgi:hypothetical protein